MDVKIVELGAMYLAGRPYYGKPDGGAFGQAWDRFFPVESQITNKVEQGVFYGLEVYGDDMETTGAWTYMPCVQVRDLSELPGVLFGKTLPAAKYAMATAKGLAGIHDVFMYLYSQWLPDSGYEVAYGYDLELYDERFHGDTPDSEIDVYVPVREKKAG